MIAPPDSLYWPILVGGPLDGQERIVPDMNQYQTCEGGELQVYVRQYLTCQRSRLIVRFYAHHSMVGRDAINLAWERWTQAMGCH